MTRFLLITSRMLMSKENATISNPSLLDLNNVIKSHVTSVKIILENNALLEQQKSKADCKANNKRIICNLMAGNRKYIHNGESYTAKQLDKLTLTELDKIEEALKKSKNADRHIPISDEQIKKYFKKHSFEIVNDARYFSVTEKFIEFLRAAVYLDATADADLKCFAERCNNYENFIWQNKFEREFTDRNTFGKNLRDAYNDQSDFIRQQINIIKMLDKNIDLSHLSKANQQMRENINKPHENENSLARLMKEAIALKVIKHLKDKKYSIIERYRHGENSTIILPQNISESELVPLYNNLNDSQYVNFNQLSTTQLDMQQVERYMLLEMTENEREAILDAARQAVTEKTRCTGSEMSLRGVLAKVCLEFVKQRATISVKLENDGCAELFNSVVAKRAALTDKNYTKIKKSSESAQQLAAKLFNNPYFAAQFGLAATDVTAYFKDKNAQQELDKLGEISKDSLIAFCAYTIALRNIESVRTFEELEKMANKLTALVLKKEFKSAIGQGIRNNVETLQNDINKRKLTLTGLKETEFNILLREIQTKLNAIENIQERPVEEVQSQILEQLALEDKVIAPFACIHALAKQGNIQGMAKYIQEVANTKDIAATVFDLEAIVYDAKLRKQPAAKAYLEKILELFRLQQNREIFIENYQAAKNIEQAGKFKQKAERTDEEAVHVICQLLPESWNAYKAASQAVAIAVKAYNVADTVDNSEVLHTALKEVAQAYDKAKTLEAELVSLSLPIERQKNQALQRMQEQRAELKAINLKLALACEKYVQPVSQVEEELKAAFVKIRTLAEAGKIEEMGEHLRVLANIGDMQTNLEGLRPIFSSLPANSAAKPYLEQIIALVEVHIDREKLQAAFKQQNADKRLTESSEEVVSFNKSMKEINAREKSLITKLFIKFYNDVNTTWKAANTIVNQHEAANDIAEKTRLFLKASDAIAAALEAAKQFKLQLVRLPIATEKNWVLERVEARIEKLEKMQVKLTEPLALQQKEKTQSSVAQKIENKGKDMLYKLEETAEIVVTHVREKLRDNFLTPEEKAMLASNRQQNIKVPQPVSPENLFWIPPTYAPQPIFIITKDEIPHSPDGHPAVEILPQPTAPLAETAIASSEVLPPIASAPPLAETVAVSIAVPQPPVAESLIDSKEEEIVSVLEFFSAKPSVENNEQKGDLISLTDDLQKAAGSSDLELLEQVKEPLPEKVVQDIADALQPQQSVDSKQQEIVQQQLDAMYESLVKQQEAVVLFEQIAPSAPQMENNSKEDCAEVEAQTAAPAPQLIVEALISFDDEEQVIVAEVEAKAEAQTTVSLQQSVGDLISFEDIDQSYLKLQEIEQAMREKEAKKAAQTTAPQQQPLSDLISFEYVAIDESYLQLGAEAEQAKEAEEEAKKAADAKAQAEEEAKRKAEEARKAEEEAKEAADAKAKAEKELKDNIEKAQRLVDAEKNAGLMDDATANAIMDSVRKGTPLHKAFECSETVLRENLAVLAKPVASSTYIPAFFPKAKNDENTKNKEEKMLVRIALQNG